MSTAMALALVGALTTVTVLLIWLPRPVAAQRHGTMSSPLGRARDQGFGPASDQSHSHPHRRLSWLLSAVGPPGSARVRGTATAEQIGIGVYADLVIALLRVGLPATRAAALVDEHLRQVGLSPPVGVEQLHDAMALAEQTGLAPSELLRSSAQQEQRRRASAAQTAAARLGVSALLPMGLCLLPAFMVLTVVPLVIGLLGAG